MKARMTLDVEYDPSMTDPEGLAAALDRLLKTALSTPDILENYGNPSFGEFLPTIDDEETATLVNRRFVLYDCDMEKLVGTQVYASYQEAVDAMDPRLQSVLVLPLECEVVSSRPALPEGTEQDGPQAEDYSLRIDGPLLRRQRQLLLRLHGQMAAGKDRELLEGLVELTDEIADQAHDQHGLDCLLDTDDRRCECEEPGYFCSGIPGILAHLENGRLAAGKRAERCDICQRYPSDEAALEKLRELGYGSP